MTTLDTRFTIDQLHQTLTERATTLRELQETVIAAKRTMASLLKVRDEIEMEVVRDPAVEAGKNAETRKALLADTLRHHQGYIALMDDIEQAQSSMDCDTIEYDYQDRLFKIEMAALRALGADS